MAGIVFSMAACGSIGSSSRTAEVPKTLIVTGIDGFSGDVRVTLASTSYPDTSMVAVGQATISDNSVAIPLVQPEQQDTRWTGIGDYFVVLFFEHADNTVYFYSQGGWSALKYAVSEATTTIAFNQFRRYHRP